jgi:hypothetical protein
MNYGRINAGFVHHRNGFFSEKRRDLPVRHIARQAAAPEVNLRIDDLHRAGRH